MRDLGSNQDDRKRLGAGTAREQIEQEYANKLKKAELELLNREIDIQKQKESSDMERIQLQQKDAIERDNYIDQADRIRDDADNVRRQIEYEYAIKLQKVQLEWINSEKAIQKQKEKYERDMKLLQKKQ